MIRRIIYMLLGATTAVGCDSVGPLVGVDESGSDPYHLLAYTRAVFDYDVLYPAWLYLYDPVRDTTALLVADSSAFGGISDPQWSPDGDRIAYIRGRSYDSTALWIVDVATTDRRMLSDARIPGALACVVRGRQRHRVHRHRRVRNRSARQPAARRSGRRPAAAACVTDHRCLASRVGAQRSCTARRRNDGRPFRAGQLRPRCMVSPSPRRTRRADPVHAA